MGTTQTGFPNFVHTGCPGYSQFPPIVARSKTQNDDVNKQKAYMNCDVRISRMVHKEHEHRLDSPWLAGHERVT